MDRNTSDRILILAAHGSAHPRAAQALEGFTVRVRQAFPGVGTLLAYTALRHSPGHPAGDEAGHGLTGMLSELEGREGLDLRVQSLHVIAGDEFNRMSETLAAFAAARGAAVAISGPLLSGPGDAPAVAEALARSLAGAGSESGVPRHLPGGDIAADKADAKGRGESVVLMGHGTTHEAQELYRVLAARLRDVLPTARLGVLEAADPDDPLSIQAIARELAASGARSARLAPFLTVAGRHAHKDLAGDQPGSWKSILAGHGVACLPDLAGLLEREAFVSLWLNRISSSSLPVSRP